MWPEVRTVLPPGGLLVISLNWLLPNLFLHEEFSPPLANMSVQGDGLFGGDLLGGRDRALTFSWHLVREPTQHPPPLPFLLFLGSSRNGDPGCDLPIRNACSTCSEPFCFSPALWVHLSHVVKALITWLGSAEKRAKGDSVAKSAAVAPAEATSPTLTSGVVWRVGAVTMSLLGRRGEGSEGGDEAQGLK